MKELRNRLESVRGPEKLLIFDTHPIQYRSPVFRDLSRSHEGVKIYFFNETFDGGKWWFHEIGKIPKQTWGLELLDGFTSEIIHTATLSPLARYRRLAAILDEEAPQAIAIYGYYLPEHWILLWLARAKKIPVIFIGETFSFGSSSLRRLIKRPLLSLIYENVSQFVTIGTRTERFYRNLGVSPRKMTEAKYCIDTHFFHLNEAQAKEARRRLRSELSIPEDAFIILFVGRLFERKRPQDAIDLHRRLLKRENVHTVLIGNGPMEGELSRVSLPRLHLLGFQNQPQTRDWYYTADLLYVPSEYETWGLVVNEAFAAGLPALVTDTCGVSGDLVIAYETGFCYPMGDIASAEHFVDKILASPSERVRLGETARRRVLNEYRTDQFAEAVWTAFQKANVTLRE